MEWLGDLVYVCPLLFIAGVIDAIAGGGGLIALPTYLMTGMPVHMAYGCGKLQCSMGSTMAVLRFWKNGVLDGKFAALTGCGGDGSFRHCYPAGAISGWRSGAKNCAGDAACGCNFDFAS